MGQENTWATVAGIFWGQWESFAFDHANSDWVSSFPLDCQNYKN